MDSERHDKLKKEKKKVSEELRVQDQAGAAECVNEQNQYLAQQGVDVSRFTQWDTQAVRAFLAAGYRIFVYKENGRVDGVVVFGFENHRRVSATEKWMVVKLLALRALTATRSHEQLSFRTMKDVIPLAQAGGAVGIMCEFATQWTALATLLDSFTGAGREAEEKEGISRRWIRFTPTLAEFTPRAQAADSEAAGGRK